jgi:hypothetical protein
MGIPVLVSMVHLQCELAERGAAASEHNARVQCRDSPASTSVLSFCLSADTTKTYAEVVPELASLLDHMERKEPILVVSTTDANMGSVLPFQLPPGYGCVVLGFFDVEIVEVGNGSFPFSLVFSCS